MFQLIDNIIKHNNCTLHHENNNNIFSRENKGIIYNIIFKWNTKIKVIKYLKNKYSTVNLTIMRKQILCLFENGLINDPFIPKQFHKFFYNFFFEKSLKCMDNIFIEGIKLLIRYNQLDYLLSSLFAMCITGMVGKQLYDNMIFLLEFNLSVDSMIIQYDGTIFLNVYYKHKYTCFDDIDNEPLKKDKLKMSKWSLNLTTCRGAFIQDTEDECVDINWQRFIYAFVDYCDNNKLYLNYLLNTLPDDCDLYKVIKEKAIIRKFIFEYSNVIVNKRLIKNKQLLYLLLLIKKTISDNNLKYIIRYMIIPYIF